MLTYNDRKFFEALTSEILNELQEIRENRLIFNINYSQLCDLVKTAKRLNKLNNSLLKNDDFDSIVVRYNVLDKDTNSLVWITLTPKKENTVKKLFVYELLNSQYATLQEFKQFKNRF